MTSTKRGTTAIFADQNVGLEIVRFMLDNHPEHLRCVVTMNDNAIAGIARSAGCPVHYYRNLTTENQRDILAGVRYMFLVWWPKIIPRRIFNAAEKGAINLHPSLLPHNRGKHYNFWTIVEETPFGVSMHFVDEGIDTGDVIFQKSIEKGWSDTGGSLYSKAKHAVVELFKERYLDVVEGRYCRFPQTHDAGVTHFERELEPASQIPLDRPYQARALLNLLRARTFEGMPACHFFDDGKKYEVRISITEADDESR
jgi:methionyl-tRNA formyltransferase